MVQAPAPAKSPSKSTSLPMVPRSHSYVSYIVLALVALVMLDFGARISFPFWNINRFDSPNKSWIWWAVSDFNNQKKAPDLVLLGSSLMLEALNSGDATYLHKPQNVSLHHVSTCLQDDLRKRTGLTTQTFSFSIAGQMASDSYAIASTMLEGANKPVTLVYGIAPRDFMDNTLTNVTTTETFKYLSRVRDLSHAHAAPRDFFEAVDNLLGKISFLYQHRVDLACIQQHLVKATLSNFGLKNLDTYKVPFELRRIALREMLEDVASNETMVCPYGDPPVPYQDNLAEYRQRYAHMNAKMFRTQLGYLDRLLEYGKQQHINVVLVNMPLTADNVATMPPGFYQKYLSEINSTASKYSAKVIDLNKPGLFNRGYFADSAHLNGLGGMRFFELLSDALVAKQIPLRRAE